MSSGSIALLDPSCRFVSGHHFSLNKMLRDLATERGYSVQTIVHESCAQGLLDTLAATPLFKTTAYVTFPDDNPSADTVIAALNHFNRQIFQETVDVTPHFAQADRIIVSTASHWLLLGFYWWAEKAMRPDQTIDIVLMFPPYYPLGPRYKKLLDDFYRNVFALWAHLGPRCRFITESDSITKAYARLGAHNIETCPIPVYISADDSSAVARQGDAFDGYRFLFAGDARGEKGSALLPDAVARLNREEVKFEVMLQSTAFAPQTLLDALDAGVDNLRVLNAEVHGDAFIELLKTADAILLPYDPRAYAERTSHILIESLGAGRPVVATQETWSADELRKLGHNCGELHKNTSKAMARAMLKMAERGPTTAEAAAQIRNVVRTRHGHTRFASFMFDR